MAGNKTGGKQAAETNMRLYGRDYYRRLGKLGGSALKTKPAGFKAMTPEQRSAAGVLGGSISRRGKSKLSPMERRLAHNRHIARYAALYKDSSQQVAKLSQKFGKVL